MNTHRRVFVSSTYTDLKEEQSQVIQALLEMNWVPTGMQLLSATDEKQFELIKKKIDECHYFMLIVGNCNESTITEGTSYTEKEYNYALEKGLKIITLLHQDRKSIPEAKVNICPTWVERLAVNSPHRMIEANHLVKYWSTPDELSEIVELSLTMSSVTFPQETALTDEKQVLFNRFFPLSKGLALPAATLSVIRNDDSIFDDADSLIAIAQKSFANSAKKAVDENDRLRIPTHGSIGGKLVVHHSPKEYTL